MDRHRGRAGGRSWSTRFASPTIMLLNGRGDYLLNLPALRAVSAIFQGRISLFCRPGAYQTFLRSVPTVRVIEPPLRYDGLETRFDPDRVACEIGTCDLFLSLNPWHARITNRLVELLEPTLSVGYHPSFEVALPLDFSKHSADLGFDLPHALDPTLEIDGFSSPPELQPEAWSVTSEVLAPVPRGATLLVVHTDTREDKMWDRSRFIEVVDWFLDMHEDALVLDVGDASIGFDDARHAERIVPCGGLPLPVASAIVACGDCFLGVDSCFLHVADLFRVPGVGLFGPTRSEEFGFRFGPHRHVDARGEMAAIETADVVQAIVSLEGELGGFGHGSKRRCRCNRPRA